MKKMLAGLTAAVLLGGMLSVPVSAAETPAYKIGDTGMDGQITPGDAIAVLVEINYQMMGESYLSAEQLVLADTDGDSKITTHDAMLILTYFNLQLTGFEEKDIGKDVLDFYQNYWDE